ncbi:MAG: nuclear transport factor 2 family protein [Actinomycetota bacterium]|nr:nuclear transport factor 2 family protein [Actinomycetota bacterium]
MDRTVVSDWLGRYIRAWESNEAEEIAALFTEDAVYSYGPFSADVVGRDAIAMSWLEDPDEPGSWEAEYHPIAIDGQTAIANGRSRYFNADRSLKDEYDNIFLIRFDADGRCAEFREWFMKRPPG